MDKYENQLINLNGIEWYPWIGKLYQPNGLFVMGESHYEDGKFWQSGNKNTTQIITQKRYDGTDGSWKLHRNMENILLNKSNNSIEEIKSAWDNIIYWNLVQRLLDSRKQKDRPKFEDFEKGWFLFFKIYEIFKPKICLALGKASRGSLGFLLANNKLGDWKLNSDPIKFNKDNIITISNEQSEIQFLFINHPSGSFGFKYEKWASILHSEN